MKRAASALLLLASTSLLGCGATHRPDGGEGLLAIGTTPSPTDLSAVDQNGVTRTLSAERGHPLIVYFYPKDGTPGCTKEACAFRDAWDRFAKAGVQVFGVSSDDQKSHEQFARDQKLPFPILADPNKTWISAFGVPMRLGMASRVSFLLDAHGAIAKIYPDVDPAFHADQVLKDAAELPR